MKDRISQLMDGELDDRSAADTIKACAQGGETTGSLRSAPAGAELFQSACVCGT